MSTRLALPYRHNHIIQNVRIDGQRTLDISMHDDEYPTEIPVGPLIESADPPQSEPTQQDLTQQET